MTNIDKAIAAIDFLRDEDRAPMDRYEKATQALGGFVLTELLEDARDAIDFYGSRCNEILEPYAIESEADYDRVSTADAVELVKHLMRFASTARDAEIELVMQRLHFPNRRLPVSEINAIRRHPAFFLPLLLQELLDQVHWWTENAEGGEREGDDSSVPFFTFMLVFELNRTEAVPLILDSLRLPGKAPFDLYGDLIHEQLPRFLAHFLADRPEQIEDLVRDQDANLYVRWAASSAFCYLVRDQAITSDEARERLTKLFYDTQVSDGSGQPDRNHPYELSAGLVTTIDRLGGVSADDIPDSDAVWSFVDESVIRRESVYQGSSMQPRPLDPTRMDDCLSELSHWAAFNPKSTLKTSASPKPKPLRPKDRPRSVLNRRGQTNFTAPTETTLRSAQSDGASQRIGRNDPCPCGSGKKYKKCCSRKQS